MSSQIILETKRCIVRTFSHDDFEALYGLHSDPDVMFFIGQGARTREQVTQHLDNILAHQERYGYSAWAVHEKETGQFIGRTGLVHIGTLIAVSGQNAAYNKALGVELGYVFHTSSWGKGYAHEVAEACLAWGFEHTDLQEIVAKTNIANLASQKILEKIGMSFQRHVDIEGRTGMYYRLSREEYYQLTDIPS